MIFKESHKAMKERIKRKNQCLKREKVLATIEKRLQELKTLEIVMQPKRDYNINGTRVKNFIQWSVVSY